MNMIRNLLDNQSLTAAEVILECVATAMMICITIGMIFLVMGAI